MRKLIVPLVAAAVVAATAFTVSHDASAASSPPAERGRYLVGAAGKCADCHGEKLQGGPLDFIAPTLPAIVRRRAPKIAGLPMFKDDAAAVHFLETGELPGKVQARPPMPQYRFNHDDSLAIVAYLKTLR